MIASQAARVITAYLARLQIPLERSVAVNGVPAEQADAVAQLSALVEPLNRPVLVVTQDRHQMIHLDLAHSAASAHQMVREMADLEPREVLGGFHLGVGASIHFTTSPTRV